MTEVTEEWVKGNFHLSTCTKAWTKDHTQKTE